MHVVFLCMSTVQMWLSVSLVSLHHLAILSDVIAALLSFSAIYRCSLVILSDLSLFSCHPQRFYRCSLVALTDVIFVILSTSAMLSLFTLVLPLVVYHCVRRAC